MCVSRPHRNVFKKCPRTCEHGLGRVSVKSLVDFPPPPLKKNSSAFQLQKPSFTFSLMLLHAPLTAAAAVERCFKIPNLSLKSHTLKTESAPCLLLSPLTAKRISGVSHLIHHLHDSYASVLPSSPPGGNICLFSCFIISTDEL